MMRSDARHLLLQGGKPLKFSLRHVGQMVSTFLELAIETGQSAKSENDVCKLLLDIMGWGLRLEERKAREGAIAEKPIEQFGVAACLDQACQTLGWCAAMVIEDDARERAKQSGATIAPGVERRDVGGEAVEARGMIDERRKGEGDKASGRRERCRSAWLNGAS